MQQSAVAAAAGADAAVRVRTKRRAAHQLRGREWVPVREQEVLHSTWPQRAWTFACLGLLTCSLAAAGAAVRSAAGAATFAAAVLVAYVLADVTTAVFHWGVDNYGSASTPLLGPAIAAFQGHHQWPWVIAQRQFSNNMHQVFRPLTGPSALCLVLCATRVLPLWLAAFLPTYLLFSTLSQQFHAWAHTKQHNLPPLVVALQDAGLLISRKAHAVHHKPNFSQTYSIVSGWSNPALDGSGFFRRLERLVARVTGVEPRCWHAPTYEWASDDAAPAEGASEGKAGEAAKVA